MDAGLPDCELPGSAASAVRAVHGTDAGAISHAHDGTSIHARVRDF